MNDMFRDPTVGRLVRSAFHAYKTLGAIPLDTASKLMEKGVNMKWLEGRFVSLVAGGPL